MARNARRRSAGSAVLAAIALVLAGGLAGCSGDDESGGPAKLRLGYFPNLTHAAAIVGVEKGILAEQLGSGVKLETKTFNAGPEAVQALFSGAIDATYIGPNPAINAHAQSRGQAIRVVSGSASGGAALVVEPSITTPEQLRGRTIAAPQLGNTQDVALRYWLKQRGMATNKEGGGDVKLKPQDNGQTVQTFASGDIDGAWVPEPFLTRLVQAGGTVLVDEKSLWPDGRFVTTHLAVRTEFLNKRRDIVKRLVRGQVAANEFLRTNPDEAQRAVSERIGKITGKPLDLKIIVPAWKSIEFTNDPIASSLIEGARHAVEVDLLKPVDNLAGLYDLSLLNEVLRARGSPEVRAA